MDIIFALCTRFGKFLYAFFIGFNNSCLFDLFHTPSYKKAFRTDKLGALGFPTTNFNLTVFILQLAQRCSQLHARQL